MNPYSAPFSESCDPLSNSTDSAPPSRINILTFLLPAVTFPASFLATAAIVQGLYEGVSSGLAYVQSLVFDFPLMFFPLAISYPVLRTVLICCSLRPSTWLPFISAAFAFVLFPVYFSPVAALIEPLGNDHLGMIMMGFTPACAGLVLEVICLLAIRARTRVNSQRMSRA